MRFRFFAVPAKDSEQAEAALNVFSAEHRVVQVDKHFVADGGNSYWSICVNWLDGQGALDGRKAKSGGAKVDYKEIDAICSPH